MNTYKTSDFRLTFADSDVVWESAPRPGLPILRWPDGTICEEVMYFFAYSAVKKRVKISSMAPEAYAIREWLAFIANLGFTIFDGTDDLMERWRTEQGWMAVDKRGKRKLVRSHQIANDRVGRKLHYVFEFYRLLPKAMPVSTQGKRTPTLVSRTQSTGAITSKAAWNGRLKREYPVWSRAESFSPNPKPPSAPREQDVVRLYSWLRGSSFRLQREQKLAFPPEDKQLLADRNWLIARIMALGGLRCQEVADFTVDQIAQALFASGITKEPCDLDKLAYDKNMKQAIIGRILSLANGTEHAFLSVLVKGKGDKERMAPFDPQLVCDLLEVGIWGIRRKHTEAQQKHNPSFSPDGHIFLSNKKVSEPLNAKAIADIIGAAYRDLGIRSSAHKLRAYYATVKAAALWREYFSLNRYNFDPSLVNNVLQNLASALGHARVTTTIKHYVNAPLFKHLSKAGTPEAELFRKLYDKLVMGNTKLSSLRKDLLLAVTDILLTQQDESTAVQALRLLTSHPDVVPILKQSRKPKLAFSADE